MTISKSKFNSGLLRKYPKKLGISMPSPIPELERHITECLLKHPKSAFHLYEIIEQIEGDLVSPISGLFYSLALSNLVCRGSVQCRRLQDSLYYAM